MRRPRPDAWAVMVSVLFAANALALSAAAVTALLGLRQAGPFARGSAPPRMTTGRRLVARYCGGKRRTPWPRVARDFMTALQNRPEALRTQVFILSDTADADAVALER